MSGAGETRPKVTLTARSIEAMKPGQAAYRVPDQKSTGLALRVAPSGVKSWDFSFRVSGAIKSTRLSLGKVADLPLEKARVRAAEILTAARSGRNLLLIERKAREAAEKRVDVGKLISLYVQRRVSGRLRTANEIERRLERSLAPYRSEFAESLSRRHIRELLDQVCDEGHPREAEKRRQSIGAMFRWAISQDLVENDPTAGLMSYGQGLPGERVLADAEIVALWDWLVVHDLPQDIEQILKLQLLLGCRCGEIAGIHAEEIDPRSGLWTLPAARSKNGSARVTPILGEAAELLQSRLRIVPQGALFRTEAGTVMRSVNVAQSLWARRGRLPVRKFTTHDLRRTVATKLVELGFQLDSIAALLGHTAGGAQTRILMRHYVRTDLLDAKRRLLLAWDAEIKRLLTTR